MLKVYSLAFNFLAFSNLEKDNVIEIRDVTGKLIYTTISKGDGTTIDLSEKAKGLYFYSISNKTKEIQQGKIILE